MSNHALYRFYDHAGELLYIGITKDPSTRWARHSEDKKWWHEVQRIAIQTMPDRESALKAEREAIKAEKPRYNIVHRQREIQRPKPAEDEVALRIKFKWELVSRDWLLVTGHELPPCECNLPGEPSCGDLSCVRAMAAFAEGAIIGREDADKYVGNKTAHERRMRAESAIPTEVP